MRFSMNWLNEYVDLGECLAEPKKLSHLVEQLGFEVEEVRHIPPAMPHVVVAQVKSFVPHPGADRLRLCQVLYKKHTAKTHTAPLSIVCGATNFKPGDYVVLALPGAVLPGPGAVLPGKLKIKKSKIRGEVSHGMLCSEKELGLKDTSEGIMVLPQAHPLGTSFTSTLPHSDSVLNIAITPNRSDCLSHIGMARELAALLQRPLRTPKLENALKTHSDTALQIEIQNYDLCPSYALCHLKNVRVGPSPDWLKRKLEILDHKSINNVVDATNYIMLETGKPLHAFDRAQIHGNSIFVGAAPASKSNTPKFRLLDGQEIGLTPEDLLILDAKKPLALAGVMGGLDSAVTHSTTEVLLESALFNAAAVRGCVRRHGIDSQSAYRFQHPMDISSVQHALGRVRDLILQLSPDSSAGPIVEKNRIEANSTTGATSPKQQAIKVSVPYMEKRLGSAVDESMFTKRLKALGFKVNPATAADSALSIVPPTYRKDIHITEDLIEEYARFNLYDNLATQLPPLRHAPLQSSQDFLAREKVVQAFVQHNFMQVVNHSFTGDAQHALFVKPNPQIIKVQNPLSEEYNTMRQSLAVGLFKNFLLNHLAHSHGQLFEAGYGFWQTPTHVEKALIGAVLWGDGLAQNPALVLKHKITHIMQRLGTRYQWDFEPQDLPLFLHPTQSLGLKLRGKTLGHIGSLHPYIAQHFKLRMPCAMFECELIPLATSPKKPILSPVPYPIVVRDISLVMPEHFKAGAVEVFMKKQGGEFLRELHIFDVFPLKAPVASKGDTPKKAVAYRLSYQKKTGTLTEAEIATAMEKLIKKLRANWPQIEMR